MDNNTRRNTEDAHSGNQPTGRAFTVHPGMDVRSSDGFLVGLIDRLFLEDGKASGVLVAHRQGTNLHKRLSLHMVDHLEDETVVLSISSAEFRMLPEYEPDHQ
jgi:hypothetical protein